jgi:hypothetical protein
MTCELPHFSPPWASLQITNSRSLQLEGDLLLNPTWTFILQVLFPDLETNSLVVPFLGFNGGNTSRLLTLHSVTCNFNI